jgi:hypothetical protein
MRALSEVRGAFEKLADRAALTTGSVLNSPTPELPSQEPAWSLPAPPALEALCAAFELSSFERKVLLMCAGVELDSRFATLLAAAYQDPRRAQPTFSLALGTFKDAHWSALSPSRPLRFWHLVEVMAGDALTTSPLRIDERALHFLTGVDCLDERLRALTEPLAAPAALPPSQRMLVEQVATAWSRSNGHSALPVIQLCGAELSAKRAVATAACATLGLNLRVMRESVIPRGASDLDLLSRLWEREAVLSPTGLLLECDEMESSDTLGQGALNRLLDTARSPLLVSVGDWRCSLRRPVLSLDVLKPTSAEQREIWHQAVGAATCSLDGRVGSLVAQFNLSAERIHAAAAHALHQQPGMLSVGSSQIDPALDSQAAPARGDLALALWEACRVQARPHLEGLAQRIEPAATWDDLVLPDKQKQMLKQISIHVRQRAKVYQTWGFASKGLRGLGISVLFAGPSGTGKTMAGEVLANELKLDLFRIDLSQVVSKYIGETEKNLRRVFDAAEDGAAILLFDEADALFGKRSEVKDSHDRYANIEVSYLLQRMEAYRGMAILTTNRKSSLDQAFLRRIRFVVEFPFPEPEQRAEIWRRIFPRATPTEGLRIDRLARLNASGGNIRNIAMGAAFLAADAGEPVRMSHLVCSARSEFSKLEKPLTEAEIAGWM